MDGVNLPQKLMLPSHVLDFHCAKCGECCCDKWNIEVDAASYHKLYQKYEQLGRQQELQKNFLFPNRPPRIQFLENGKCPYLLDNNLCRMQLELGESYLLDICKTYPRRIFASSHTLEFALVLTCKTAVQTLQRASIHIIEMTWPIEDKNNPFSFIQPNTYQYYLPDTCVLEDSQLPYYVLEKRFIEILQDRRYSIQQRLIFLGQLLIHFLSANEAQVQIGRIQDIDSIYSNNPVPDLKRHLEHLFFISNIFLRRFTTIEISQLLQSILLTLTAAEPYPPEPSIGSSHTKFKPPSPHNYQKMLEQYYKPAYPIIEPILENYLVNCILDKSFYLRPLHLAYYRMTFTFAAIAAFGIGYSIIKKQLISQPTLLQAIYDVESTFYNRCFYPRAANFQTGQSSLQIIENGIALANI